MTSEQDAWDSFKAESSFQKAASIQGQLDAIAAQNNEIQTDMKRIADVIGQIQGDNAAMDYANADPMTGGMPGMPGGMPPMGGMPPGMTGGAPDGMPPGMGGMPPEAGGEPGMGEGAEEGMPPEEGMPGGGEDMTSDNLDALLASLGGGEGAPEGGEDFMPMGEDVGEPTGGDMVEMIKDIINNTDDPGTLEKLGQLLQMAVKGSPAQDMQSGGDMTMNEDMAFAESDGEAGTGFGKSDGLGDGVAEPEDAKQAEEAVTDKNTMQKTPELDGADATGSDPGSTQPFKNSASSDDDEESDDESEDEGSEEDASEEGSSDEESDDDFGFDDEPAEEEVAPDAGDPVVDEIVDRITAQLSGLVEEAVADATGEDAIEGVEDHMEPDGDEGLPAEEGDGDGDEEEAEESIEDAIEAADDTVSEDSEPFIANEGEDGSAPPAGETTEIPGDEEEGLNGKDVEDGGPVSKSFASLLESRPHYGIDGMPEMHRSIQTEPEPTSYGTRGWTDLITKADGFAKSAEDNGRHIMSIGEMLGGNAGFCKAVKPDNIATCGGDLNRPSLDAPIAKTAKEPFKMGFGIDPHKAVEKDWERFNFYKSGSKI